MTSRWRAAGLALLLGACAGGDYRHLPVTPAAELADAPFFPQDAYQCGPASLATVLNRAGAQVTPETLTPYVFIPQRRGSLQADMLATPAQFGYLGVRIPATLPALLALVDAGYPVVVLQNLGARALPVWHYAVVIGYDLEGGTLLLRSGTVRRRVESLRRFEKTWERAGRWGMVVVAPGPPPPAVTAADFLAAASVLERLRQYRPARRSYLAAADTWPDNALAWAGAGNSAYAVGAFAAAEHDYRRALAHAPDDPLLMNNLAMALAQRGCRQAALALITCAQRTQPHLPVLAESAREIAQSAETQGDCRTYPCPYAAP